MDFQSLREILHEAAGGQRPLWPLDMRTHTAAGSGATHLLIFAIAPHTAVYRVSGAIAAFHTVTNCRQSDKPLLKVVALFQTAAQEGVEASV